MTDDTIKILKELHGMVNSFRIRGSGVAGNLKNGYTVNPGSGQISSGSGGGPPPPPTVSGACCYEDGTCAVVTQAICEDGGGTYQGDNTDCDPNPCPQPPPTGACCVGTICTIETEDDCTGMGGTYQGDGTDCDPNPCEMPPCCPGAFSAFDGSGRMFLTKTTHFTRTAHTGATAFTDGCDASWDITTTDSFNSVDCSETVSCSGTYSYVNITHPTLEFANCSWVSDGFGGCTFVLDSGAGGISCGAACYENCDSDGCSTTITATQQQTSCSGSNVEGDHCEEQTTETLSDECAP